MRLSVTDRAERRRSRAIGDSNNTISDRDLHDKID